MLYSDWGYAAAELFVAAAYKFMAWAMIVMYASR